MKAEDQTTAVVDACVKRGFAAAAVREAMESLWKRGLPFDDVEAVVAELGGSKGKKKGGKKGKAGPPKSATFEGKQEPAAPAPVETVVSKKAKGKKSAAAAPKAERAAVSAPAAPAAPTPAVNGGASHGTGGGAAAGDEASKLETVAALDDLSRTLDALGLWVDGASEAQMDTFFSCRALPLLLDNMLAQNPQQSFDDELTGFLHHVLGGSTKGVMAIVSGLRAVCNALAACADGADEGYTAQVATARRAAADRFARTIRSYRGIASREGASAASSSAFESVVAANTAALAKFKKDTADPRALFEKRDHHEELVSAFTERVAYLRGGPSVPLTSTSASGAMLEPRTDFNAAVSRLSPHVDHGRVQRVRSSLDAIRREESATLAPFEREESALSEELVSLRERQEELQRELREVEAAVDAATARRRKIQQSKADAAASFKSRVAALDGEHAGMAATLQRADAAAAASRAAADVDSKLRAFAAADASTSAGDDAEATATRARFIDTVLSYAKTERSCIEFIAKRIADNRERLVALGKELASYEELRMGTSQVANNVRDEIEKTRENIDEDEATREALTGTARRLSSELLALVRSASARRGAGVLAPITEGEAEALRSLRTELAAIGVPGELPPSVGKVPGFDQQRAQALGLTALIPKSPPQGPAKAAAEPSTLGSSSAEARAAPSAAARKPEAPAAAAPVAAPRRSAPPPASKGKFIGGGLAAGQKETPVSDKRPTFSWGKKAAAPAQPARSLAEIQAEEERQAKAQAAAAAARAAAEADGATESKAPDADAGAGATADVVEETPKTAAAAAPAASGAPKKGLELPGVDDDDTWGDFLG